MDDFQAVLVQRAFSNTIGPGEVMIAMSIPPESQPATSKIRICLKLGTILSLILVLHYGGQAIIERLDVQIWPMHENIMISVVWICIGLYVLSMTLPFVPGIEMGLALMTMFGVAGVAVVYLCTLVSLTLSFAIGRLIPLELFSRFLGWLHLHKARNLVLQLAPLEPEETLPLLLSSSPSKIVPYLVKHRYLLIALALNLPGNVLIGGGGGIGLIAGMSRLYPFPKFLLLISLAITPVPMLFLAGLLPVK